MHVMSLKENSPTAVPRYGPLPVPGLPVQVQCDGFKCMAVRDKQGRWVDFFTHELLLNVLGVVLV